MDSKVQNDDTEEQDVNITPSYCKSSASHSTATVYCSRAPLLLYVVGKMQNAADAAWGDGQKEHIILYNRKQ